MIGVFAPVRTVAVPVLTGTSSPTCNNAGWLSNATIEGDDRTRTSVTLESKLRTTFGFAWEPSTALKPGDVVLSTAEPIDLAASKSEMEPVLLLRKYWTPYCSWLVSVTSATVASIATDRRGRSTSRKARSTTRYC